MSDRTIYEGYFRRLLVAVYLFVYINWKQEGDINDLTKCHHCIYRSLYSDDITTTQTGEETFFKIKKTTKMNKVFQTYANRKGVQLGSLRFLLDGERIEPDQTPKMLELDDQDQIDCMLEQSGGC